MSALVVLAWSVTASGLAWRFRPVPTKVGLDPTVTPVDRFGLTVFDPPRPGSRPLRRVTTVMGSLGRKLQQRAPSALAVPETALGAAVVIGVSLSALSPLWALVMAGTTALVGWRAQRAATQRRRRRLEQELPNFIDLVRLSIDAGLTVRVALVSLAEHVRGELGAGLDGLVHELSRGDPLASALQHFGASLGPPVDELMTILATAERTGAPVGPALAQFADDLRRRGRVVAEERARRLPVLMLLPLVFCVLPAFVIVAVVPMLATGASAYSFPSR